MFVGGVVVETFVMSSKSGRLIEDGLIHRKSSVIRLRLATRCPIPGWYYQSLSAFHTTIPLAEDLSPGETRMRTIFGANGILETKMAFLLRRHVLWTKGQSQFCSAVMSYHVLSCPVMCCHVLSCPIMSCHVLSCPVMSCQSCLL